MYIKLRIPQLPLNPRIRKAELKLVQDSYTRKGSEYHKLALYKAGTNSTTGLPYLTTTLVDFERVKTSINKDENKVIYSFDVTKLIDSSILNNSAEQILVLKMMDETETNKDNIVICGTADTADRPALCITYDAGYAVNGYGRNHSHDLGRFGRGSVDLERGNLTFDSTDFSWQGSRMPLTLRHIYNSAYADYQYTHNDSVMLNTADFGNMKLGRGWKLNIMQSMTESTFQYNGRNILGYIYTDENGAETYFKETAKTVCGHNNVCYHLHEDVDETDLYYDSHKRELYEGAYTKTFDEDGRLISITDDNANSINIKYTAGRITSVTDGAGREFSFAYTSAGFLSSVTGPDESNICYGYNGEYLNSVIYPDGERADIECSPKAVSVLLSDEDAVPLYRVKYKYTGDKVTEVCEEAVENGSDYTGQRTKYQYSASSRITKVITSELSEASECRGSECEITDKDITTVYCFDADGSVISSYAYSKELDKTGVNGDSAAITPYAAANGTISNINNLLKNHNFRTDANWTPSPNNCEHFQVLEREGKLAKFGDKALMISVLSDGAMDNGLYQETMTLPAGEYTFSAYVNTLSNFENVTRPGVFLRVTEEDGELIAESEHISKGLLDYERLSISFSLDTARKVKVWVLVNGRGSFCLDAAQLENNAYASDYNMVENGSFEASRDCWTSPEGQTGVAVTGTQKFSMTKSLRISGDIDSRRILGQDIYVAKHKDTRETFTLSGWARAGDSVTLRKRANCKDAVFALHAEIYYKETEKPEVHTAEFVPGINEWQPVSITFAKTEFKEIDHIRIVCEFSYNRGYAYFDNIQLIRSSIEEGLTEEDFKVYDESEEYVDRYPETNEEYIFDELRDKYGNTLTSTTFTDGEFGTIYNSYQYNSDRSCEKDGGNDLIRRTDSRGNNTYYRVDPYTSRNEEITDRCGNKTSYEYDGSDNITYVANKNASGNTLAEVSYTYDAFDHLTEIARGDGMKYSIKYNKFRALESIGVQGKTKPLAAYTYKNGNGRLKSLEYANGSRMDVSYNALGQLTSEKWYDADSKLIAHYKYVYDSRGNIVRSLDIMGKIGYNYLYEDGRIVRATESTIMTDENDIVFSQTLVLTIRYSYDTSGRMIKKTISPEKGEEQEYRYEYPENRAVVVRFTAGGKTVTSHSNTDTFGRREFDELQLGNATISRYYSYHDGKPTEEHVSNEKVKSSATTSLVSQIKLSDGRVISYEYDKEERITKIDDTYVGVTEYTYDAQGQLLTESWDGDIRNTMTYDGYGNITSKNGIAYTYSDSEWGDLLTGYCDKSITYDEQGNPTNYLGHKLKWEKGRQLKSFDGITYTYNASGIRTSRTYKGVEHKYTLDGTKILRETWGTNTLVPLYDNFDSVCGIVYNSKAYFFIKNLQGDVIAVTDKDGETVAEYAYDAWGDCIVIDDRSGVGIANINPFRYRGYYLDIETGLYYLQSRYYNPTIGRFINADEPNFYTLYSVLENNSYTYCFNDPVNNKDEQGQLAAYLVKKIVSVLLGVALGLVQQFLSDVFLGAYRGKFELSSLGDYVSSAVNGGWDALWGGGLVVEVCKSLLSSIIGQLVDMWNGKEFKFMKIIESIADGLISYVLNKIFPTPKFIRDIKEQARIKGIRGTKRLVKYLNNRIALMEVTKFTIGTITDTVYQCVKDCYNYIIDCAKTFFYGLVDFMLTHKCKSA